jgi:glycerophosphoryl diester phosphodiesterase
MSSIRFDPPLIAHRGASAFAPENTLSALLRAKELGATWVEFDVMLTADGEAVVIHDETLDRTTNGRGAVDQTTYLALAQLDAGSWFKPEFAGERVPVCREVIAFLKEHQLSANVEIKGIAGQEEKTVIKVLAQMKECWTADMPAPLISSFSMPILQLVRKLRPEALLGMLIDEWFAGWGKMAEDLNPQVMNLNQVLMTPALGVLFKKQQKLITCYTVNEPARALELFAMGVDAVFTDNLVELLAAL